MGRHEVRRLGSPAMRGAFNALKQAVLALLLVTSLNTGAEQNPPQNVRQTGEPSRFGFAALNVRDLDQSVNFYTGNFGMKELFRIDIGDRIEVGLGYGDGMSRTNLVLVGGKGLNVDTQIGSVLSRISFYVPNVRGLVAQLSAKGVPVVREPVTVLQHGVTLAFVKDLDGVQIELIQAAETR